MCAATATTMPQLIAFLRAINVGGHTVKMEQLRALFAELGFANVETFIASGNVIFDATAEDAHALERQIEAHLQRALGYSVATFIRAPAELAAVAAYQPFAAEPDVAAHGLYVAFLASPPSSAAWQKLLALQTTTDAFHVHERELYWLCRTKMSDSAFSGARLEKTLVLPATLRNMTTVQKLAAKYTSSKG